MLKATMAGKRDGAEVTLIVLGLTPENLQRLVTQRPIHVFGTDIGLPGIEIVICAGSSEDDLIAELKSLVGPETQVMDLR